MSISFTSFPCFTESELATNLSVALPYAQGRTQSPGKRHFFFFAGLSAFSDFFAFSGLLSAFLAESLGLASFFFRNSHYCTEMRR